MLHLVRYKLKPEHAADNDRLVRGVFEALQALQPSGLRYAALKSDDGLSFVHVVSHESDTSRAALTGLPAFKAFSAGVRERCDEPPAFTELSVVGSYRLFGNTEGHE